MKDGSIHWMSGNILIKTNQKRIGPCLEGKRGNYCFAQLLLEVEGFSLIYTHWEIRFLDYLYCNRMVRGAYHSFGSCKKSSRIGQQLYAETEELSLNRIFQITSAFFIFYVSSAETGSASCC